MKDLMVEVINFTAQQEEYVLSCYAAFEDEDTAYNEFREAFPDAVDRFAEHYGERNVEYLQRAISVLHPRHPDFPANRLGVLFDALRRHYLTSHEDSLLGQSRNRLRIAEEILFKLQDHAKSNPEEFLDSCKLQMSVLKDARAEDEMYRKLYQSKQPLITPEEVARLIAPLSDEQLEEFTQAYNDGEHPNRIIERIQQFALEDKSDDAHRGSDNEEDLNPLQEAFQTTENQEQGGGTVENEVVDTPTVPGESDI